MNRPNTNAKFEALLEFLRQSRGFDFTGYKRASLTRRVNKRMELVKIKTYDDYMDYLEVHPEEFGRLFNAILINVTAFFRDPTSWDFFIGEVIPKILKAREPDGIIRVWSAGCASGEEAYSLSIAFAEAIGVEAFGQRVKIYATDVDEEALNLARQAAYSAKALEPVSEQLRKKYFQFVNERYVFRPDLRRSVIFGRHDLIQDAPISRLDLLVSRNTLMYFNAETQAGILSRFHFALNRTGFLFLGKAELLLTHAKLFIPLDMKNRIFSKVDKNVRDQGISLPQPVPGEPNNHVSRQFRLRALAFDSSPLARIIVNRDGILSFATQKAKTQLGLIPRDIGRPIHELEIYYRPAELRPLIEQAYAERRTVTLSGVERRFPDGEAQYLDVQVMALSDDSNTQLGVGITYLDVTHLIRLQEELQRANQELETSSEELQSTNEELETTNEELQSTNEELETMNDELQSTNEELHTLNDEMRQRSAELDKLNIFLNSILSSMRAGVAVLDNDLLVQIWNFKSEDLWGLRFQEVQGKPFTSLDVGLPVDEVKKGIRSCLAGETGYEETVLQAVNRRGKRIQCRVTCSRLHDTNDNPGIILLMEEID